jgi:acyl-CoA hydrolase
VTAPLIDLRPYLPPGAGVWWGQAGAEPQPLVHALLDQLPDLGSRRAFCGLSWDRRLTRELPEQLSILSYGGLGELRALSRTGRLEVLPCHYAALPRMFAEGFLPTDVGFVQVSPPDAAGTCSLGIGVDYAADAIPHTQVLIAEVNQQMPVTTGSPRLPIDRFAAVVHTDRPLTQAPERAPDEVELAIARHVAALVEDGDTVQLGVGSLPAAVLDALSGHTDLGVHTGMITDGVLRLAEKGVITGARKEADAGLIVTGSALGTAELYSGLDRMPVRFRPASYTHSPATLSQFRSFVAINSAIEVDLSGQIGAEMRRGAYVGAVGGQVDFSRAAALTGARSIIALRSTSRGESTINARIISGVVTTSRSDVDFVVTEHGIAQLRGRNLSERARALIAVAAPEHREALEQHHREEPLR